MVGISAKGMVAGDGVAFDPACDRLECRAERLARTLDEKIEDRKMPVENVPLIGRSCKRSAEVF